ncbi:hypothetical protein M408DRAFT_329385 [Serendipita vermifera MAFF 305830]|uniref:Uncharacterized protein n=1 Tax=Serendipita vermifera MAFF 305830 TaxID=933852 RepID=A0A0C3BB27_SERVB|nr:hypothetical protein M408DRAFT_329385 [Serendipita vermifera MAFF 305830]
MEAFNRTTLDVGSGIKARSLSCTSTPVSDQVITLFLSSKSLKVLDLPTIPATNLFFTF